MFEYIKGLIQFKSPEYAVIETNGVGYQCLTPLSTFSQLPDLGQEIKLFTSLIIREDAHTIYGFYSKHERDLFRLLINVSGIGPKTALALVGHLGLPTFNRAIFEENATVISKVPGIGKKTASRLIVEMKDKLQELEKMKVDAHLEDIDSLSIDAINALVNLGYHPHQAKKAVEKIRSDHQSLSTLIPSALQRI